MPQSDKLPVEELAFQSMEFMNAMCGKQLGETGSGRTVFELPITDGKWCVKIESGNERTFQNIEEWNVWQAVEHTKFAKWFAPCNWISPNGRVLIMRQTERPQKAQYPDRLPKFFTDIKFDNFGMLDGQFVCHDYGHHLLTTHGLRAGDQEVHWF